LSSIRKAKTAIITGSGRGIGKQTAILLEKKEVNVVVCSTNERQINSVVQEIDRLVRKIRATIITTTIIKKFLV
jgi:short-subunit dehydrogenase